MRVWDSLGRAGIATALLWLAIARPALAQDAGLPKLGAGVDAVLDCMRKNLPARSARQDILLEHSDASGQAEQIEAELFWKRGDNGRSRVLIRVEAPPELRGSAFLLIEREGDPDLFTYLPELQKVRRITTHTISGSLFGTDFSYEDLLQLQGVAGQTKVERLPDGMQDGHSSFVVSATPALDAGSAYARIVTHIDRETCVANKTEFFAREGELAKEMSIGRDHVEKDGERWVPRLVVLRDLGNGSETRLTVKKIALDVDLNESFFSEAALTKGH